ncbi:uncharacterized protein LOC132734708 [Ruditapes philippinarum]|uniref:uncharacterized protein LOC132734708 n=1 Tax=Ruditapes philippinarum TaxID=129788 RepID=UPI00295BE231|nr:uncharacterized protein LOC132734708 [Ruditapes philippinarum]
MMNPFDILFLLTGLILIAQHQADGLKCYKCSSILDSACSDDWELTTSEAAKFEVKCSSSAKACQKIVGEIQGTGVQHVYRQCWNHTGTENYIPTGCEEDDVRGGVVCRCTADICNGQQRLLPSDYIYFALLSSAALIRQYYYSILI